MPPGTVFDRVAKVKAKKPTTGLQFSSGKAKFSGRHNVHNDWDLPSLPTQWVIGALSPEVKRPGHEADH
jgi:hypothetical protein